MNKIKNFLMIPIPVFNTGFSVYMWYAITLIVTIIACINYPPISFNVVIGFLFGTIVRILWGR